MPRKPRPYVAPERETLKTVLATLKLEGIPHFRNNTGMIPLEYKGKSRLFRAGEKDWPDVIFICPWDGKFGGLELKRKGKRPTDGQMTVLRNINHANGVGFWLDDAAPLRAILGKLKNGCRIEIDENGNCFLTDEATA